MNKGIMSRYLVAIILGITILAISSLLILRTGGRGSKAIGEEYCSGKLNAYCTLWLFRGGEKIHRPGYDSETDEFDSFCELHRDCEKYEMNCLTGASGDKSFCEERLK